ncbi:TetR/AcrR family transcriptional regulator [Anaerocolumna sp.]|uniref:TetR/AcrR family transcriptional regulator n=1 Tax=Anaerocolumna sp. TaxID=2041569 RepID=UPI0028B1FE73|nr:TetR/AcrR family transcriptional regulator [Anaerocolumna sp.]
MSVFESLPEKKRERIVNAALTAFGTNGYKKTSVADVAALAGISKAMVFHYFGTKQGMYRYIANLCGQMISTAINNAMPEITSERYSDFFERMMITSKIKLDVMKANPAIMDFLTSMFMERNEDIRPVIDEFFKDFEPLRRQILHTGVHEYKFKNSADISRVEKMLTWMANGCAEEWKGKPANELDEIMTIFEDCMNALKNHFYKEEYR